MTPPTTTPSVVTNRIDKMFAAKRARGECALIFYVTAGYPDLESTERVIGALAESGADLIELGIPFSDPIADGPTIQHSSKIALERGITVKKTLDLAARIRVKYPDLPILFFGAYNPILIRGVAHFIDEAAAAGADGVLIPDLPPQSAGDLREAAQAKNLSTVFLVAPTTSDSRAKTIAEATSGFVYYISLRGVTGARAGLPEDLEPRLMMLKRLTDKPIAVGFGVSLPEHVRAIASLADGVVIGSALIKLLGDDPHAHDLESRVRDYARSLADAAGSVRAGSN